MELDSIKSYFSDIQDIEILGLKAHTKSSEYYVIVKFNYRNGQAWEGWVPYISRRIGLNIQEKDELIEFLQDVKLHMNKEVAEKWYEKELLLWNEEYSRKGKTKPYFDAMAQYAHWSCRKCITAITTSSNDARRIQEIKDMGYLCSTDTNRECIVCGTNTTHELLIAYERAEPIEYETMSPKLIKRIVKTFKNYDVYEAKQMAKTNKLIPDHKFSEVRWDEHTAEDNPDDMSETKIKEKFQLLSNQRNQQKREVCRECFQTGIRGKIYGIDYFYEGDEHWPKGIPLVGKDAEKGCIGCPWYDIELWRKSLNA